ncbi:MAG: sugar phosphate isomerase/epimerase family protein [Desulforhabdus sp.]|jgi:sugar phosphate isomerase/epimerase|nr:sugar phosphate isomerase/epimerase family protein [Desulforhabdus sp.]
MNPIQGVEETMLLGYNTNGLAHHNLLDAIEILAEIGYASIAVTIDHYALNPYEDRLEEQLARFETRLRSHGMRSVVETGARFLLNPRVKHAPTLMDPDPDERDQRVDFYCRCIDIADQLGSDCVSIWSGILHEAITAEKALARLAEGLGRVLSYADRRAVTIGFEPEPGMFIDNLERFERLLDRLDSPYFHLTLDLGHLHCTGETPIAEHILRWGHRIVNVHIEDMRQGIHEHLMFGEGEMDFPPIMEALAEVGYRGGLHVELSRHSHNGVWAAKRAYDFLKPLIPKSAGSPQ